MSRYRRLAAAGLGFAVVLNVSCGAGEPQPAARGATQEANLEPIPQVPNPAYDRGVGPVVGIDSAHNNFHTAGGRYAPLAELLRRDGYRVVDLPEWTAGQLEELDILVIANARSEQDDTFLPSPPAFTQTEVGRVERWVTGGGALLLVTDHMPMGAAADLLARAFGVRLTNGYSYASGSRDTVPDRYTRAGPTLLLEHAISRGRGPDERVDTVATFVGNAFQADPEWEPVLRMGPDAVTFMTREWGVFEDDTPTVSSAGWLQGAVRRYGQGRVAMFGEAAMFTAQKTPRGFMGIGHAEAEDNAQFALNVLHWLSGLLSEPQPESGIQAEQSDG